MPRALWTSLMRLFRDRLFVVGRVVHGGPRLDVVGAGDVSKHFIFFVTPFVYSR